MPLSKDIILEKFKKPFVIGVSGVATSGKDTFFSLLQEYLRQYGITVERLALADKLKQELDPFLRENVGISAWTTNQAEKTLIRPMLVAYGKVKRMKSNGTHWTSQIEPDLKAKLDAGIIPVVTDIRYGEYENDEIYWLNKFGGKLVYVTRWTKLDDEGQRVFVQPPNEDEARNDPFLRKAAHKIVAWNTVTTPTPENLSQYVEEFILSL